MSHKDYKNTLEILSNIPVDSEENFLNALKGIRSARWVNKVSQLIKKENVEKHIFKPSGNVVWLIRSKDTHLIIPASGFCSCLGFFFSLMRGRGAPCAHLVTQKYCEKRGLYKLVEHKDSEYDLFIQQIISQWNQKRKKYKKEKSHGIREKK